MAAGVVFCNSSPLFELLIDWASRTAEAERPLASASLQVLVTLVVAGEWAGTSNVYHVLRARLTPCAGTRRNGGIAC